MAREYHNLAGWVRDVRKAVESGHQLAYEAAEVIADLDDLLAIPEDGDGLGDESDGLAPDADDGPGLGQGSRQLHLGESTQPDGVQQRLAPGVRSHSGPQGSEVLRDPAPVAGAERPVIGRVGRLTKPDRSVR